MRTILAIAIILACSHANAQYYNYDNDWNFLPDQQYRFEPNYNWGSPMVIPSPHQPLYGPEPYYNCISYCNQDF